MKNYLLSILEQAKQFVAPAFCNFCRVYTQSSTFLCVECIDLIRPVISHYLLVAPKISIPIFAASSYQEPIKSLILAKSWSNALASTWLAQLMLEHTVVAQQQIDCIVPIPLHWTRYAYRGFNQSQLIANELGRLMNKPVVTALKRSKRTPLLSHIATTERAQVMKGSIVLNGPQELAGRHILLVDDVMTTGATLQVAAKALLKCKPASIKALVAARTV